MKNFCKTIFIFIYLCLTFFINSNGVFADCVYSNSVKITNNISEQKSKITLFDNTETYHFTIQNNNTLQIANLNNKNSDFDCFLINKNFLYNNLLKYIITDKKITYNNRISHNISLNLENAIYTRAP